MHFISLTFYGKNSLKDTARKPRYVLFCVHDKFLKNEAKMQDNDCLFNGHEN